MAEEKIRLFERIAAWMEVLILTRFTSLHRPGIPFKWIFKIPILYYRLGLGWLIGKRILLLTTTGRRTGKPRATPLQYVYHPDKDWYRISPGWAGHTDWYRNLLKDPHVRLQVGRRDVSAIAEPAPDAEAADFMLNTSRRNPGMDRVWSRWSDRPVDGSWESYLHAARIFPAVWLKPLDKKGN